MSQVIHGTVTGTAAAILSITGTSGVDTVCFVISGLTAETISVTGTVRASVVTAKLRPFNLNTGTLEATDSDLGNGSYMLLDCNFESLVFTKSSTSENATITYRTKQH